MPETIMGLAALKIQQVSFIDLLDGMKSALDKSVVMIKLANERGGESLFDPEKIAETSRGLADGIYSMTMSIRKDALDDPDDIALGVDTEAAAAQWLEAQKQRINDALTGAKVKEGSNGNH